MKLMFLGAPGAGKGTQAEIVSEKYHIPAISTGAIIREAIKNGTEMGLAAKAYTESGELVPDDVVIGIIKERLANDDCKNGFILDGFPRTVVQAEALDAMGIEMDLVISIEVADEAIVERMSGRRTCVCGATLTVRADDAPEVVKSRLVTYHEMTEPLKAYYEKKGKLSLVLGQEKLEDTTALTQKAIEDACSKQ